MRPRRGRPGAGLGLAWALAGALLLALPVLAGERAMLGHTPGRNMALGRAAGKLPATWNPETGLNVKWVAELGSETYGGPVVAGGKVFVGTNNERPRDPQATGDRGVVMAFAAADGRFLWQSTHDKLAAGRSQDWPLQGVCSTPAVDGDRLYYLSNRAELVALDAEGFADGENDGPVTDEPAAGDGNGAAPEADHRADVVWTYDLQAELGVIPRYMAASSPLLAAGRVFVVTGNGPSDGEVPAPEAPSFVAFDAKSGKLLWQDASPGAELLEGQWASPAYGVVGGVPRVYFPGGDGRLYAFEPATGKRLWSFDANQPLTPEAARLREAFIAAPVIVGGRLYVGAGRDPELGPAGGRLLALDLRVAGRDRGRARKGKVATEDNGGAADDPGAAAVLWHLGGEAFGRTLSTVAVTDDLLFATDLTGFIYCLEADTGKELWRHDTFAGIWGSPLVADGKVYVGDEDGNVTVLAAERKKELLAEINLGDAIYTTPTAADGVLYVATRRQLFALADESKKK